MVAHAARKTTANKAEIASDARDLGVIGSMITPEKANSKYRPADKNSGMVLAGINEDINTEETEHGHPNPDACNNPYPVVL